MRPIIKLIMTALCALTLGQGLVYGARAQETFVSWEAPRFLGNGWWQSISVDRTGTAHIVWYGAIQPPGSNTSEDLLYYTSRSLDGSWAPVTDVIHTGSGGFTVRNAIDVTSDGMLYAFLRSGTDHMFALAPSARAWDVSTWDIPIQLGGGYYLDLLVDSQDIIHAVSSSSVLIDEQVSLEDNPCAFCGELLYWRSEDKGRNWQRPVNLTNSPDAGADRMDIYEGPSGRIYIDWDEGYDWYVGRGNARDVRMIYSEDNGVTWSEPIVFAGESQTHKPIQIASAELLNGVLLVVWRYNSHASRIYYQISEDVGQTWSQPQPVPGLKARDLNDTPLDDYELITDNLGVGHLFVVGRAETDSDTTPPSLFHVEFRQGQWRRPVMVYRGDSANMPEWPKADIGPQNDIHLTWFIRHDSLQSSGPSTSRLQVYYSYRKPTQPLQPTLAFEPTTTPYPTSTPDYAPAPTLTPFPTAQPIERVARRTNSDIYAAETLLGALLICAAFCGGVYGIYRFWGR